MRYCTGTTKFCRNPSWCDYFSYFNFIFIFYLKTLGYHIVCCFQMLASLTSTELDRKLNGGYILTVVND
jgi:hypothetical protein